MSLGRPRAAFVNQPSPVGVKVVQGGQSIPQDAMMELTARYKFLKHPFNLQRKMADLWISQTPIFVEVYHRNLSHRKIFRKPMEVFDKI